MECSFCLLDPLGLYSVVQVHCFLIFCLHGLSIVEKRRIKVPPITVLWFISPFSSASICVIYLGVPMVSAEVISP